MLLVLGSSLLEVRVSALSGRCFFMQTWSSHFFFCLAIKHHIFFSFVQGKVNLGGFSRESLVVITLIEECLTGLNSLWQTLFEKGCASYKDGQIRSW